MQIREIENKNVWDNFCLSCQEKTFTQSFSWGDFNKLMGEDIWRYGLFENNELIAAFMIIKTVAKRGTFLLLPMGPIIKNESQSKEIIGNITEKLKELAKKEKADFIRLAPILKKTEENVRIFKDLGFIDAPMHVHPELTWELDISKDEDIILAEMRKTTRYLIRQGMKNEDLEIQKSISKEDLKYFNSIYEITAQRHNFTPFSMKYLENELKAFSEDGEVLVFTAKYSGEAIASAVIIFWSNIAFYHQGASSQKYPKVPASYLLQWEAIKEAKKRGCIKYNFWGIAEEEEIQNKNHPWAGLTLFKKGFGGHSTEYVKAQDYPITFKYHFIRIFELLRKKKRNL